MSNTASRLPVTALVVVLLVLAAVVVLDPGDRTVPGTPVAVSDTAPGASGSGGGKDQVSDNGVDPRSIGVRGTDGGQIDRLAATVISDVQSFWRETFPTVFGQQWHDIAGGFYSVDTADSNADAPPCAEKASDIEGNAFYCPTADIVAWDRAALLPVLKERFGESAVMVVFAHEIGHAVQRRTGLTLQKRQENPRAYPTILIESMADCYAGSFVAWVVNGKAPHLHIGKDRLGPAMAALSTFRDPLGTSRGEENAHGDGFDRVASFQDGFDGGAKVCSQMTTTNHTFTQTNYLSPSDQDNGGNLTFDELLRQLGPDVDGYFGKLVDQRGKQWPHPTLRPQNGPPSCGPAQGVVALCGNDIDVNTGPELRELHGTIGDFATGTLLTSRYALAALAADGKPTTGFPAQSGVLCLTGAYMRQLLDRGNGFSLSPGDLDEAVQVLLQSDYPSRDSGGQALPSVFDRIEQFRQGVLGGVDRCGLS